jgi:hypothetical protein
MRWQSVGVILLFALTPPAIRGVSAQSFGADSGARDTGRGGRVERGAIATPELLTSTGNACPVFRRAPNQHEPRNLEVALAFEVDTMGAVDSTTFRVVQTPTAPQAKPEFFPHMYVVGTTTRVDPGLRDVGATYDSLVTADMIRHVAALRFRPGVRKGRPARSTVLVSCQAR